MNKFDLVTYGLAVCALVVVGLLVNKEFFFDDYPIPEPVRYISETDTLALGELHIGPENAKVTIIEFFDYECPYCKAFQKSVDYITAHYPDQVRVQYVHFPLNSHQHALKAAVVAECANTQNKFLETHEYLFLNQEILSTIDWEAFAGEVGISENQDFSDCINYQESAFSVERDILTARQLGIGSIPTYLINGKMYEGAMPPKLLERLVQIELE